MTLKEMVIYNIRSDIKLENPELTITEIEPLVYLRLTTMRAIDLLELLSEIVGNTDRIKNR